MVLCRDGCVSVAELAGGFGDAKERRESGVRTGEVGLSGYAILLTWVPDRPRFGSVAIFITGGIPPLRKKRAKGRAPEKRFRGIPLFKIEGWGTDDIGSENRAGYFFAVA